MRALPGTILVVPLFEQSGRVPSGTPFHATDAKIEGYEYKGLVLPSTGDNPQSQQGTVIASGIDEFNPGMLAAYMPYHGERIPYKGRDLLCVPDRELAAWLEPEAIGYYRICPRKGWLLIQPEWPEEKVGNLFLPEFSGLHDPVNIGRVLKQGDYTVTEVGTRVVYPPDKGFEIGLLDVGENLYLLNEQWLLAYLQ